MLLQLVVLHSQAAGAQRYDHGALEPGITQLMVHAGVYKTLANIFISFLGAGILSLPHAFAMSGLLLGGGFLTILAILAYYCILLLVDCKKLLEHKGVVCVSLNAPMEPRQALPRHLEAHNCVAIEKATKYQHGAFCPLAFRPVDSTSSS